jgi:sulfate adenylyltransferase subunit 2
LKKRGNTQVEIVCKQLLLDAIEEFKFDACIGGARRDEEKHELKSVFFLFVMIWSMGRKNQRPELFDLLNGK